MSATKQRTIAVLGGGGFIGSHLVETLVRREQHLVLAVDRTFDKLEVRSPRLSLYEQPIDAPGLLEGVVVESDLVVSLTALCNPALYNTRPVEVIHAGFTDLLPLVEACTAHRRPLLHLSTSEVYGKPVEPGAPMSEDSTPTLLGPVQAERWSYATAKLLLERLIYARGVHDDLPFTIVRPFNTIGPRMDFYPGVDGEGLPRVLAAFLAALHAGEPLQLVDGGRRRRPFLWIGDLVDGLLRIIDEPGRARGEILNLGNPANDVTIAELARRLAAVWMERVGGPSPTFESVSAEAVYGPGYDDIDERVPDVSKAERLLGWRPLRTLDEMLPDIVDAHLARYGTPR